MSDLLNLQRAGHLYFHKFGEPNLIVCGDDNKFNRIGLKFN